MISKKNARIKKTVNITPVSAMEDEEVIKQLPSDILEQLGEDHGAGMDIRSTRCDIFFDNGHVCYYPDKPVAYITIGPGINGPEDLEGEHSTVFGTDSKVILSDGLTSVETTRLHRRVGKAFIKAKSSKNKAKDSKPKGFG